MGSFAGHVIPGSFFLLGGVWQTWCSLFRYHKNPTSFRARVWNVVPGFNGKLKFLQLYLVVIGSFIDLCIELLYATHLNFFVHGELNPSYLNNFEHSGMLMMFFIFGLVALLSEKTRWLPVPHGVLNILLGAAFCAEFLLFNFHSTTHKGLEGYYLLILLLLIAMCMVSCVSGAFFPASFASDLTNAIAITMQGLWFYQTALTLYGPMMPAGCSLKGDEIVCGNASSRIRGEYLANLQLFGILFGVFVFVVISQAYISSQCK